MKYKKNGPKNKSATEEELEFIVQNYGNLTAKEIGEKLGRSAPGIAHIISRNKIQRSTNQRSFDTKGSSYGMFYAQYKHSAKNRNYSFDLTKEQFVELAQQNCHYCNSEPKLKNPWANKSKNASRRFKANAEIPFNGIDRVDNSLGYEIDNCAACCYICNHMKSKLSVNDFIEHVNKICKYNNKDHLVDCKKPKDG